MKKIESILPRNGANGHSWEQVRYSFWMYVISGFLFGIGLLIIYLFFT